MRPRNRRLFARVAVVVVAVAALVGILAAVLTSLTKLPPPAPACHVAIGKTSYELDLEQAENAATIAAVGKREGLPDHAVTVALAAALQESKLHNLEYGDRDSIGLFQQRPSQGWGSREQLLMPTYAAQAFYRELRNVSRWNELDVTEAAQRVQRSAAPYAYATWEPQARTLASALTGETPHALTCSLHAPKLVSSTTEATSTLQSELGVDVAGPLAPNTGWTAAAWLVAHADTLRLRSVGYGGMRWHATSGKWASDRSVPVDRIVTT